jgi:hypothetical protein
MRNAIAINGAHFTAQRMLGQYLSGAYVRRGVLIELPRPGEDTNCRPNWSHFRPDVFTGRSEVRSRPVLPPATTLPPSAAFPS